MTQKYYLDANTTTTVDGKTLYQIVANHNITTIAGNITAGTTGGFIQNEGVNLHHNDEVKVGNLTYTSWISAGKVLENAQITGGAVVGSATAVVRGDARVDGLCNITGSASIKDKAMIMGTSDVGGNATIFENASVYDNANVAGTSALFGSAKVYGNANLSDSVTVFGNAQVFGNTTCAGGNATTASTCVAYGNSQISGSANLTARQIISGTTKLVS